MKIEESTDLGPDGVNRKKISADPSLTAGGLGDLAEEDPKLGNAWGMTRCRDLAEEEEALMRGVPRKNLHRV